MLIRFLKENGTLIALVLLVIILSLISPEFFTARNLSNLSRQVTIIGIMSVGMTLVILINGIDLSVGSVVGLSAILVTLLMQNGLSVGLSIFLTLLLSGVFIGLWNGFWIARYRIPPFIITLGMMTIARGLALTLSGGGSVPVTDQIFPMIGGEYLSPTVSVGVLIVCVVAFIAAWLRNIQLRRRYQLAVHKRELAIKAGLGLVALGFSFGVFLTYLGIPVPVVIFAIIALIGVFVLNHTRFGRRLYAMGGNEEAARLSGINLFRTKMIVFTVMSVLASLSGIILASRLNGASPNLGNMFELDTIAAVVIGGTSLSGGAGTIGGSIIGTFIIGILDNGMSLLGVNIFYQLIAKGMIIILAVWFDVVSKKRRAS